jgi:general L-amino acid transport system permease protein
MTSYNPQVRLAPTNPTGPIAWLARNLFSSPTSTLITLVMTVAIGALFFPLLNWALFHAVWTVPGNSICRAESAGACWAVIGEKYRFILFGLYPFDQQWRPALAIMLFLTLFAVSTNRRCWGKPIAIFWIVVFGSIYVLMVGGSLGLPHVPESRWGGLPVTLLLTTFGIALAFPIAICVALGRTSDNPSLRFVCLLFVEIVRGVPLISVLFMASVLFPLFMPEGIEVSKLVRALLAISLFIAAYLSEIIRGGIQTLGPGQKEAAAALGLGYWHTVLLIQLPQALVATLPPMVSLFIGLFKSTSLVMTIGIFDLLNAAKSAVAEPAWQGFGTEAYLFAAAIYFSFCLAMSRYGLHLERETHRGR